MTPINLEEEAPYLQRLLEKIADKKGFKKPRFTVTVGTKPGDNYVGAVFRAVLTEDGDEAKELSVILKTVPPSAKRREMMSSSTLFRNEARMYDTALAAFAELLADKGMIPPGTPYPDAPECVMVSIGGSESEETIVLRDMKALGFVMQDRKQGLDAEHCLVVVRALARLHACSMALEQLEPARAKLVREEIKEVGYYQDSPFSNVFDAVIKRAEAIYKTRFAESSPQFVKVKKLLDNFFYELCDMVLPDPEGGNCIAHGDSWTNNMLFKYSKDTGRVESVCLLDFQIARYCSPVLDLSYFLYSCTVRELRDKHWDEFLRAYHTQLQDHLRSLGCEPDKIFSWELLQSHLKKYARHGLAMSSMLIPVMLTDSEDVPDLNEECEKGNELGDIFIFGGENTGERDQRMCDVLAEVVDRGYNL